MRKIVLLTMIISMLSLTGCVIELGENSGLNIDGNDVKIEVDPGVRVETGDIKTFNKDLDIDDQKDLDVTLEFRASNAEITKTDTKLFEGEVRTNIVGMEPRIDLSGNRLIVRDNLDLRNMNNIGHTINDWNLKLTDKLPISLQISSDASKNDFDFTGLQLSDIEMSLNAANTNITFDEANKVSLEEFDVELNAGNLDVEGLDKAGAQEISIRVNAGKVSLSFDDDISKNTEIDINANVSKAVIDLPDSVGISITKKGSLSSIEIARGDMNKESQDKYVSKNYDSAQFKIDISVNGNASSVTIK